MNIFKRIEKQLDELHGELNKASAIANENTTGRLTRAYVILETSIEPLISIIKCVRREENKSRISMISAEELAKNIRDAKDILGEVIGEDKKGGVKHE